jgi:serine/threonine-protein kinase ULK/ATG1
MEERVAERRVGDYMLLRQIGSGAYSRVWLGKHLARGTEVAVKEIAMERLSSKLRDSLLSEVDILRSIRHPNVIALHDSIRVPSLPAPTTLSPAHSISIRLSCVWAPPAYWPVAP